MIEIENNILNDKWYLFFDTNTEEAYNLIKKEIASPDIKVRIREMARRYHSANHGTVCIGVFKGDEAKVDGCVFKAPRVDNQTTPLLSVTQALVANWSLSSLEAHG